ncbi:G-type lectin S-receptor-like serine/threonine-protein kinase SD2-5-like isoform X2 [Hibiscus syriacus]|uniref:Receptor-like serine/threonine-protein kinase n=1 Tax=Hibiscus syriacus TaxID=106335 RepID=A0A6A2YDT6_HIBSY|nr:G-type lectin S-receptor-like serine/threonine-protein kinase SD2-5 [Hibiscus syriacus]KAE8674069.1 G-type lectin S-receptor-like serine/threonine-protein kinase SD2-5-like isoform X2 [Hibiscus syriacus]
MSLFKVRTLFFNLLLAFKICIAVGQLLGQLYPGFQTYQTEWEKSDGKFLFSKSRTFALGFYNSLDTQSPGYLLVIGHVNTCQIVWTANIGLTVGKSDKFVFDNNGNVYLERRDGVAWATNTTGENATSLELLDSGNLVLRGTDEVMIWQSFSYPTDTLLSGQEFVEGMRLQSFPKNNKSDYLEFQSGDLVLYTGFPTPQTYWSLSDEMQETYKNFTGKVYSAAVLVSNTWNFYDHNKKLIWRFNFSQTSDMNVTWAARLGADGVIMFYNLNQEDTAIAEATKIPQNPCNIPDACPPFMVCYLDTVCQCPKPLVTTDDCSSPVFSTCNSAGLLYVGRKLDYSVLKFVKPNMTSGIDACKKACLGNCSCSALFFDNATGDCFLFDRVGSLKHAEQHSRGFVSFVKVSINENGNGKRFIYVVIIATATATVLVIAGLLFVGFYYYRKKKRLRESAEEKLEDDNLLESFPGMPVRYTYRELCKATKNFSKKVGQGGFGSVYQGEMPDGTQLAVKKLEGIGQGKKEFRVEVRIIGSIHHVHLVKLKGFCSEGVHRLLVYEFMGKKSLDKWIFKNDEEGSILDWNTRFNIALGTAKGLAYLHEECEVKIVHCDIKPENVLLDDNFNAKVSDFGLAKLISREDSLVYTTLRGTRGYLAPEWITNNPISEKSDVYSYGMVLFEIIGGRKSYDPEEIPEKSHLPSFALKMLKEGNLKEVLDPQLDIDENDESFVSAIKVAVWCIQEDFRSRPPMTKVVQMLQGLCPVPEPAISSVPGIFKWNSGEGSTLGTTDYNSDEWLSEIKLSGPR